MKKEFLLCAFLLALVQWSNAQTVKLYSSTGVLKNTYTSVGAAIVAATDGDSLLMSPHVFKESMMSFSGKNIILQGTMNAMDSSTIDANRKGPCFYKFYGTIRDVILTGGGPFNGTDTFYGGGCITIFNGHLTGNSILRNNIFDARATIFNSIVTVYTGNIDGNVKVINNVVVADTNKKWHPTSIMYFYTSLGNSIISDNVFIANNKGSYTPIGVYGNTTISDTAIAHSTYCLRITGNVQIINNQSSLAGAILLSSGASYTDIDGATIMHNVYDTSNKWSGTIAVDTLSISGGGPGTYGRHIVRMHNVRMYNPLASAARAKEIALHNQFKGRSRPAYFYSDACWWGNSDTTGLFQLDTGTYFSMPTWAVTQWSATPFGTALSNVRSQMKLNTGAALPSSSLSGLQADFWATAGTFSAPTATINASNYLASDYYFPTSGSYKVYAAIDADTFKPSTKALGIPYLLPTTKISIYPNPILDYLHLESINPIGAIRIIDSKGQTVLEANIPSNKHSLEVSSLAKGMYWIIITGTDGVAGKAQLLKE
jgi:hypothetical protein